MRPPREARRGLDQPAGVVVLRAFDHVRHRSLLAYVTELEDEHLVGHRCDHAEVMGDEEERQAEVGAEPGEQLQHGRLRPTRRAPR